MKKTYGSFEGSDGITETKYYIYEPDTAPKAMIQIVHGMCEYLERYEPFIRYLTSEGFMVAGCDLPGHGRSVSSEDDLGFFGEKDGWMYLIKDTQLMSSILLEAHPDLDLFMFAHSMGSFVARIYAAKYGEGLKGLILSGTAGNTKGNSFAISFTRMMCRVFGPRHKSPLTTFMMFGKYNSRYKEKRTPYDWISRDKDVVDDYMKDPLCTFMFTESAYRDLVTLTYTANTRKVYDNIPRDLSVLVLEGSMDPVSEWGRNLASLDEGFLKRDFGDYEMKIYKDMRHELHNEIGKEEVWEDVASFVKERI